MTAEELNALAEWHITTDFTVERLEDAENHRQSARVIQEASDNAFRAKSPRWLKCPACVKNGFRRAEVWEPFSPKARLKCQRCGEWDYVSKWVEATK